MHAIAWTFRPVIFFRRQEPVSLARDPGTQDLFVTSYALAALLVRDEGVAGSNPATPTSFPRSTIRHGE